MRINQNKEIAIYRGETVAIDFKISQRTDYYVPFLISSARVNPMICITIGSTRRESKNIVSKQLWLDLADIPKFSQTVVEDLDILSPMSEATMYNLMVLGKMYQFKRLEEVNAGNPLLHFAYALAGNVVVKDDDDDFHHFTITLALDETITLDMTSVDYYYQIELMDTVPMIQHLVQVFSLNPTLINKLSDVFNMAYAINPTSAIEQYTEECVAVVTKTWPDHWGYRIKDPLTSDVASVSNVQMIQSPRSFTVHSVVK